MTLHEIQDVVQHIQSIAYDSVRAHMWEVALYQSVLQAIANGTCEAPQRAAALVLTTNEIRFQRWRS